MVTERTIVNGLIIGASVIFVPFLISSTLTIDYAPAFCMGTLAILVWSFFFLKDKLSIWPFIAGSIQGSLNFLPIPLTATHVFCILLILYYVTGYVLIRQKRVKVGKPGFFWPILIVTLIVLYHNHSLSGAVMGGEVEGGKPAILIYIVVIAYFCAINISNCSVRFLSRVPLYCLIASILSSIPFMLSTFFPSLAPILYYITDNVNLNAYMDTQATASDPNSEGGIGRLSVLGPLGGTLMLYLLCHYPIGTWLRPNRWWVAALALICTITVVASGYRSTVVGFSCLIISGTWCYYSWRVIILPTALCIAALILFIASSNNLINLPANKLPLIVQRTLSFLPGDWDSEAVESAKVSNEFRQNIINVYLKENLTKSPWIGNGFDIDRKEYESLTIALQRGQGNNDGGYLLSKTFIMGKAFHTGWLSVYDCVGIIGFISFLVLAWNVLVAAAHFVFKSTASRNSPLFPAYVWILCSALSMMITYFTVYGEFKTCFSALCIVAMVLSQLMDIESAPEAPIPQPDEKYRSNAMA